MKSFKNRTVLVTGGSRGIGRAICLAFAREGARVIVGYHQNGEAAAETLDQLDGTGHASIAFDVCHPTSVKELFQSALQSYESIDVVVNNAGIGFHHPIDESTYEEWQKGWEKILQANLVGPANVCYHAARHMMERKKGYIINVTSRGAFRGEPEQPAYGASKAGLNSLTQSLAHRLSGYDIFVGAVAPGFVETDMAFTRLQGESGRKIRSQSPMKRVAKPSEVAQAVVMMATANIWMTGGIFDVNGASYFRT